MSENTRIAKNTLFLYFRSLLMMVINLYASRVILQALGISDYGLYGAVGSMVSMFTIVNGVLASGTSRFLTFELGQNNQERLRKTFSASFAMHLGMASILFLLLESVGLWFVNCKMAIPVGRENAANVVFQLSVLSCMFSLTQVPYSASIIAHERMGVYAYVGLAEATFKLLLVMCLLYIPFTDNLIAYAAILTVWSVALQVFYRFYCRKRFSECNLMICRDKVIYKGMLSYSLWDLVGQFCGTGNMQGLNILFNLFFGVTVNAARAVAYQVENVITQFSGNFMTAINPQIVKSYAKKDYKRFFQLIYESGKYSFFLLFLISLPLFLETEYILSLWLVEVPAYTVFFMRCVMAITLYRVAARPLINGVHATGNVKILNLTSGVYSAGTFLPVIYLFYSMGFPVWTCFAVQAFNATVCTFLEIRALYINIKFDILDYLKKVYLHSFIVMSMASVIPLLLVSSLNQGVARLVIVVLSCIGSTVFCVYAVGLNSSERQKLHVFVNNQYKKYQYGIK